MDIFNVLTLLGGVSFFLFGMHFMGEGLGKLSGSKMEVILEKLTSNKIKGVLLGTGVTAVIQSSAATTVMVVGFVNSGIMKLRQAVGIILGANIGTTVTAWILSLSGVSGDNILIQLLKPKNFSPIFALIGVILLVFTKKQKNKDIGTILVSFAVLMYGMEMMSGAMKSIPNIENVFTMFSNPILLLLIGVLITALLQSSSASVGILQALCATGAITYSIAIPIILGQNIGSCITTMISSVGATKNGKKAAFVHLYFNIIGTTLFLIIFYTLNAIFKFPFTDNTANQVGIALVHTAFNVVATSVLLPFSNLLVKLAELTVRDTDESTVQSEFRLLDPRFLERPAFAVETCRTTTANMAKVARESIYMAIDLFHNYDEEKAKKVIDLENLVDGYEDELGAYLVKLSSKNLSEHDSKVVSKLLHSIGDFERLSDHSLNLQQAAEEMYNKQLSFSPEAVSELEIFEKAIRHILDAAVNSYIDDDKELALTVEPLEEVIDVINDKLKSRHVKRLRNGQCTIELGFILSDITNNFERIADHCSNIAVCELQMEGDDFESHDYLGKMKTDDESYKTKYNEYLAEYTLP